MSERYANCHTCHGRGVVTTNDPILLRKKTEECGSCGGTGQSGDAMDYMQKEVEIDDQYNPFNLDDRRLD